MTQTISTVRKHMPPMNEDTWESMAAREFPNEDPATQATQLQSWNLHVFMRPASAPDSPRAGNPILPSDVIFLEPPLAK